MLKKWIIINSLISIIVFAYIFHSHMSKSGGDMAIGALNVIFGFIQLITIIAISFKNKSHIIHNTVLTVVFLQIIQMIILVKWGYDIRNYLINY
jgi:hypothetical protein